jgi:hypothetical protein
MSDEDSHGGVSGLQRPKEGVYKEHDAVRRLEVPGSDEEVREDENGGRARFRGQKGRFVFQVCVHRFHQSFVHFS